MTSYQQLLQLQYLTYTNGINKRLRLPVAVIKTISKRCLFIRSQILFLFIIFNLGHNFCFFFFFLIFFFFVFFFFFFSYDLIFFIFVSFDTIRFFTFYIRLSEIFLIHESYSMDYNWY